MDGIAVDWSKCYDHLPLLVLEELALAAGVPRRAYGPMLSAYFHPWHIVVDGQAAIACILTPGVWRGRGSIVSQPFQTVGVRAQAGVILSDGQKGS